MNMGMFSKKETERSGMMNTTKAFTLMLHFAEQFDPLRHLNSDGKLTCMKKDVNPGFYTEARRGGGPIRHLTLESSRRLWDRRPTSKT
ncbi:hypothetical protein B9Z55_026021 [Caenorhabditis nigoni]|uniref:Uncharacterized protein n=1 Tax=Caenorhabditis nigoni TaxID=1611254 RepID=A0A2G5T182_9PELO|nr:hypothetical protein B9Z55_026021 [Caenorhabditis nigoni]